MKHRALKLISFILLAAMLAAVLPLGALAGHVELSSYEYGTAEYYSYVSGRFISDRYYYSDLFFSGDPAEKNDELALISARLSSASTDDTHGAALLKKLGFSDVAVKKYQSENADDCAYTTGRKTISIDGTEYTLIAVSVQSSEYGLKGWLQNVSVNNAASADSSAWTKTDGQGGDHAAYRIAAESITADLSAGDIDEKTIIWICGQSRGGGIANLAAAYIARGLKTKDGIASPVVFAYTFEAPATTSNTEDAADAVYACIHNYVCDDDIVTMVPMWGMVRYGTDVIYNTADVADVIAALVKQNPDAEAYTREYDVDTLDGDVKAFAEDILAKLLLSVPTRGDYSAPKSDSFTQDGKKTEIEYCYQNGLRALCTVVSGGEGDVSENLSSVFENREAAPLITYGYMEEVYANEKNPENKDELLSDAAKKRWEAAGILYDAACAQMTPDFDRSDMYALVKLAGPLLINTKKVTGEGAELPVYDDEFAEKGYRGYFNLAWLLKLTSKSGYVTLLFSHPADTVIARLKMLAPAPAFDDPLIIVVEPNISGGPGGRPKGDTATVYGVGEGNAVNTQTDIDMTVPGDKIIDVTLPQNSAATYIRLTVRGASSGTVAAILKDDGSREIIKETVLCDGVTLSFPLKESARVQIINNEISFTDVPADSPFYDAVTFVSARGIFNGVGAGLFAPQAPMTRGMLMTVLARCDGVDAYGADWLLKGVSWSAKLGVFDGADTNAALTREQFIMLLWLYAGSPSSEGSVSGDAAVSWAEENGILSGLDGGAALVEPVTRGQAAQIIMNYYMAKH